MRGIRQKAVRGIIWTALRSGGNQIISFLLFIILTRLLTPTDFGLIGMATVFTSFASIFAEQGFGQAIVQRRDLDAGHIDTAFWTNLGIGSLLTIIGFALAGSVATLFGEPLLEPVIMALSVTFLFTALKSTQQALLQREFKFQILSIRLIVANSLGGVFGIVAAILGAGVYALVIRSLVTGFLEVVLLWKSSDWRPRLFFSREYFRDLFSFGMDILGVRITNFARRRSDDILIGYFLGAEVLGYYMVAYRLARLLMDMESSIVGEVVVTTFARLQDDLAKLRLAFEKVINMISLITFPMFTGLIILAPELILLFSGEKWLPSVPIMQILSVSGYTITLQIVITFTMIGIGETKQLLKTNFATTIMIVFGFLISTQSGIIYVAVAYTCVSIISFLFFLLIMKKKLQFTYKMFFYQIAKPTLASGIMALIIIFFNKTLLNSFEYLGLWGRLVFLIIVGVLTYGFSIFVMQRSIFREIRNMITIFFRDDVDDALPNNI